MCGIAGFYAREEEQKKAEILLEMTDKIIPRGPDESGSHVDDRVAMGMRRLSIIGLVNGSQPIYNEDKTLALVFNGEIYNYKKLKEELIGKGHLFVTDTDSEVLMHGYEEYGVKLLDKLRGMFAFAIWNYEEDTLFIARDMFGIKPLFYSRQENTFLFGSEIKSILVHPAVKKEFNEEALEPYLSFQYSALEETFYKGIYQLLPGHYMVWKNNELEIKEYWRASFHIKKEMNEEEAAKRLDEVLRDSVEAHKVSDVEMGAFLSGGIDSSYLVAASRIPKTYSVGFGGDHWDETKKAEKLCEYLGIQNTKRIITEQEFWDAIPKILEALDEPVADPSIIPLYYLCELASRDVKVVISGEGSDELFGGYNIYQTHYTLKWVKWIPFGIRRWIKKCMEKSPRHFKGKEYLIRAGQTIEERFIGNAYIFHSDEIKKVLKHPWKQKNVEQLVTAPYYDHVKNLDDITKMQYIDISFWLRGDILRKSDHISMAHSLEVRVPFLDREVANLAFTVPTSLKVTKKRTKNLFRKAAESCLPEENTDRRKLGFPVPLVNWLKQDKYYQMVHKMFTGKTADKYFNQAHLVKLLDNHRDGHENNTRKIWNVYLFLNWYEMNFAAENE